MPPFLPAPSIGIPVVSRSPERDTSDEEILSRDILSRPRSKKPMFPSRIYSDDPLPVKPSETAPREAHITARIAEPDRVAYTINVGGMEINDVGVEEVLDYVSPFELEQYENKKFEEEREILRIARIEEEAANERRRERQRSRAKTKGTVVFEEVSEDESDESESRTGKHGRSRPTYTHLFEKVRQRKRRRRRDPATGELMPLSDEEGDQAMPQIVLPVSNRPPAPDFAQLPKRRRRKRDPLTGELMPLDPLPQESIAGGSMQHNEEESQEETYDSAGDLQGSTKYTTDHAAEHHKRRRRKRDKITGELLPLEPLAEPLQTKKRPRRRRHPLTGELMPLGWKYDPEAEKGSYERRRDGTGPSSPAFQRLSISRVQEPKRVKLTSEPSSDEISRPSPQPDVRRFQASPKQAASVRRSSFKSEASVTDDLIEEQAEESDEIEVKPTPQKAATVSRSDATPKSTSKGASTEPINLKSFLSRQRSSSESSSGSEMNVKKFQERPKAAAGAATIMNPVAAERESEDEEEDDEDDGEGFDIEDILAHHMSDPRTHPGKPSSKLRPPSRQESVHC